MQTGILCVGNHISAEGIWKEPYGIKRLLPCLQCLRFKQSTLTVEGKKKDFINALYVLLMPSYLSSTEKLHVKWYILGALIYFLQASFCFAKYCIILTAELEGEEIFCEIMNAVLFFLKSFVSKKTQLLFSFSSHFYWETQPL